MRFVLLVSALSLTAASAVAADYAAKGLKIASPWSRPAAQGATGAGYLSITNTGQSADVLLAVEAPSARSASMHRTAMNGGVMSMREIKGGLAIPPGKTVTFAPGGDHIMLTGLKRKTTAGETIPATLVFQKAGRVAIAFSVQAAAPAVAHHH